MNYWRKPMKESIKLQTPTTMEIPNSNLQTAALELDASLRLGD